MYEKVLSITNNEVQIKIIKRYYLVPIKMIKICFKKDKSIGKHTENLALLYNIVGNINGVTSIESNMTFSQIIKDGITI